MLILKLTRKRLALLEAPERVHTWYRAYRASNPDECTHGKGLRLVLDDTMQSYLRCREPAVAAWLYRVGLLPLWVVTGMAMQSPSKGAFLDGCRFFRCKFANADFSEASTHGAIFNDCNMTNANFSHAYMRGVEMHGCDAKGADFTDACIVDAQLPRLKRKQVKGANLRGAMWLNPKVPEGWKNKHGHLKREVKADANRPRRRSRRRFRR